MTIPVSEVGDAIAGYIDAADKAVISFSWTDFYKLNDASALREARKQQVREYCWNEHDLLISYGDKAVLASRDRYINRVRL